MKTIILKRKIIGQTSLFVSYLSNKTLLYSWTQAKRLSVVKPDDLIEI